MSPASSLDPAESSSMSSSRSPMTHRVPRRGSRPSAALAHRRPLRQPQHGRRKRAIDLYTRAKLSEVEFDAIAADVERELKTLDDRLAVLRTRRTTLLGDAVPPDDVLAEIRETAGRTTYQRPTDRRSFSCSCAGSLSTRHAAPSRGRKQVRVVIDYRFPASR